VRPLRAPPDRARAAAFSPDALHVSWIDLRRPPQPAALAELDTYERARAARFAPADRARYEAAHCALRSAIRTFCGAATQSPVFRRGVYGKPSIAQGLQCHFSLSYSGDLAVIALTRDVEIGVDVERERPIDAVEELAASHFAPQETTDLLTRQPGAARNHAFLRGWVRKEACVKAVGHGLAVPTGGFVSGIGADPQSVVLTLAKERIMLDVGTLAAPPGHLAAWAAVIPGQ
jgi:4'-phosphopantetheinyl transferase